MLKETKTKKHQAHMKAENQDHPTSPTGIRSRSDPIDPIQVEVYSCQTSTPLSAFQCVEAPSQSRLSGSQDPTPLSML